MSSRFYSAPFFLSCLTSTCFSDDYNWLIRFLYSIVSNFFCLSMACLAAFYSSASCYFCFLLFSDSDSSLPWSSSRMDGIVEPTSRMVLPFADCIGCVIVLRDLLLAFSWFCLMLLTNCWSFLFNCSLLCWSGVPMTTSGGLSIALLSVCSVFWFYALVSLPDFGIDSGFGLMPDCVICMSTFLPSR